jgi:hypothetical protein
MGVIESKKNDESLADTTEYVEYRVNRYKGNEYCVEVLTEIGGIGNYGF